MKKIIITLVMVLAAVCSQAQGVGCGYHGNVETGYLAGIGDWGRDQWVIQTTHGYQIVPNWLFVGAGAGAGVFTNDKSLRYTANVYGNVRSYLGSLAESRFLPFVDLKAGYGWVRNDDDYKYETERFSIQDGFYFQPAIGCRYALKGRLGISISIGYNLQTAPVTQIRRNPRVEYNSLGNKNIGGITFKAGFDF